MKSLKIFSTVILVLLFSAVLSLPKDSFAQKTTTETLNVSGECGMCKKKIEKAAKEAGATYAVWTTSTKLLTIKYNSLSTNSARIQQKIADAGYDTPKFKATDESYNKLDACCQYDRTMGKDGKCCSDACEMKDGKCVNEAACKEKGCCKDSEKCKEMGCCVNEKGLAIHNAKMPLQTTGSKVNCCSKDGITNAKMSCCSKEKGTTDAKMSCCSKVKSTASSSEKQQQ